MESDSDLSGYSDNTFYVALIAAILLLALAAGLCIGATYPPGLTTAR
jgi:uncharacterized membrane protein